MAIKVKTEGDRFTAGSAPKPKTDMEGKQRTDRLTGELLFQTQLVKMDENGAEVITCTTAGMPRVDVGQDVVPVNMIAIPWQQGQRSGVAFRADGIELAPLPAGQGSGSAKAVKDGAA